MESGTSGSTDPGPSSSVQNGPASHLQLFTECQNNNLAKVTELVLEHKLRSSITAAHINSSAKATRIFSPVQKHVVKAEEGRESAVSFIETAFPVFAEPLPLPPEYEDTTKVDDTGKLALHHCAKEGSAELVERVLDANPGAIDLKDNDGFTPLNCSVIWGNKEAAQTLLSRGANVNNVDNEKHSLVHWATVCANKDVLHLVLQKHALPSTPDITGAHPLHYATQMCTEGEQNALAVVIFSLLLRNGANPNGMDFDERTPLHWAACSGSTTAVQLLLQGNADKQSQDRDLLTPLHCAAGCGHVDVIRQLLEGSSDEDVNVKDRNGSTPLFYAVALGYSDTVKFLLDKNAQPNWQDKRGRSAAHCGAAKGQLKCLKLLHQYGASFGLENNRGDLPLHEAVQSGCKELVLWLLEVTPSGLDSANHTGRTPLHIAAATGSLDLCGLLVARGASMNPLMYTRQKFSTPLDLALQKDHEDVVEFLRRSGGKHTFEIPEEILQTALETYKMNFQARKTQAPVSASLTESYSQTDEMPALDSLDLGSSLNRSKQGGSERMHRRKKKPKLRDKGVDDLALLKNPAINESEEYLDSSQSISTLKQSFSQDSGIHKMSDHNQQSTAGEETDRSSHLSRCLACKAIAENKAIPPGVKHTHGNKRAGKRHQGDSLEKAKHHRRIKNGHSLPSINDGHYYHGNQAMEDKLRRAYGNGLAGMTSYDDMYLKPNNKMNAAKRYAEEKRIFQELAQLKRLQIQYGPTQEEVLVRRMTDNYANSHRNVVGRGDFQFNTFSAWEKFLYDQLKVLYLKEAALISGNRGMSRDLFAEKLNRLPKIKNEERVEQLMKVYGVAPIPLQYPTTARTKPPSRTASTSSKAKWQYWK